MKSISILTLFSLFLVSCATPLVSPSSTPVPTTTLTMTPSATMTETPTAIPSATPTSTPTPVYILPNGEPLPDGIDFYYDTPFRDGQNRPIPKFPNPQSALDFINNVTGIADFNLVSASEEKGKFTRSIDWGKWELIYSGGKFWNGTSRQVMFTLYKTNDGKAAILYEGSDGYAYAIYIDMSSEEVSWFFALH